MLWLLLYACTGQGDLDQSIGHVFQPDVGTSEQVYESPPPEPVDPIERLGLSIRPVQGAGVGPVVVAIQVGHPVFDLRDRGQTPESTSVRVVPGLAGKVAVDATDRPPAWLCGTGFGPERRHRLARRQRRE